MGIDCSTGGFLREVTNGTVDCPGTALTIHIWAKRTSGDGVLINRWGTTAGSRQFQLQITSGTLGVNVADASAFDTCIGPTTISTGAWHSLALRKNGTGINALQCWLDGVADNSVSSSRTIQSLGNVAGSQFRIGIRSASTSTFNGKLAEACIWLTALSDEQMVALARGATPLKIQPDLIYHYWPMWEAGRTADLDATPFVLTDDQGAFTSDHAPVGCPFPLAI